MHECKSVTPCELKLKPDAQRKTELNWTERTSNQFSALSGLYFTLNFVFCIQSICPVLVDNIINVSCCIHWPICWCCPDRGPGSFDVEDATTLSWSSAAMSEWVSEWKETGGDRQQLQEMSKKCIKRRYTGRVLMQRSSFKWTPGIGVRSRGCNRPWRRPIRILSLSTGRSRRHRLLKAPLTSYFISLDFLDTYAAICKLK